MPRQREPKVDGEEGRWIERVIGGHHRQADPDHAKLGEYGFFRAKYKVRGVTVIADVYPDFGTTQARGGPFLWGVVFPEQAELTHFDDRTQKTTIVRPYAPERRFGHKAPSLAEAKREAELCVRQGGFSAIPTNENGTLKALDREPEQVIYDDVPDDE